MVLLILGQSAGSMSWPTGKADGDGTVTLARGDVRVALVGREVRVALGGVGDEGVRIETGGVNGGGTMREAFSEVILSGGGDTIVGSGIPVPVPRGTPVESLTDPVAAGKGLELDGGE